MNAAQIHLALNHLPLFLSLTGGLLLLFATIKKNGSVRQVSFYLLIAGAISALPVFFTGHGTEELVEEIPGISEDLIKEHEEIAQVSLWVIGLTGIVAFAGLFLKGRSFARALAVGALILSFISFGTIAQTAHLGGQIRHSEMGQSTVVNDQSKEGSKEKAATKDQKANRDDD